jgi:hypothetical protein
MRTTKTTSQTSTDPSRYSGHAWLLSSGFDWNGDLEHPVYTRRTSGVMTRIERRSSWWLLQAFKYVDELHRDANVPGLSLALPGLTPLARAIKMGEVE